MESPSKEERVPWEARKLMKPLESKNNSSEANNRNKLLAFNRLANNSLANKRNKALILMS